MQKDFYLILHNIRSAYNVGATLRTAEGLGVKKVFLTGYTPAPSDEERPYLTDAQKMIAKTALGAEKFLVWERFDDLPSLIERLKKEKIKIIALEQDKKSVDLKKYKPEFPSALILGNETEGTDPEILALCDEIVFIPMKGQKESFNVSVAAGIAMYVISTNYE